MQRAGSVKRARLNGRDVLVTGATAEFVRHAVKNRPKHNYNHLVKTAKRVLLLRPPSQINKPATF